MNYSIGEVSRMFGLPQSTLRYYDKEGLFPALTRTSGIRRFGEQELEALRVIECLKRSGLEIKEIKQFMEWCAQGSETYPQRHALFVPILSAAAGAVSAAAGRGGAGAGPAEKNAGHD